MVTAEAPIQSRERNGLILNSVRLEPFRVENGIINLDEHKVGPLTTCEGRVIWRRFTTPQNRITVTSEGAQLSSIVSSINKYASKNRGVYLGGSGEGRVYALQGNDSLVIKEIEDTFFGTPYEQFVRMEASRLLCDRFIGGSVRMPKSYAVLERLGGTTYPSAYVLMEKINGTPLHVLMNEDSEEYDPGRFSEEDATKIIREFFRAEGLIKVMIKEKLTGGQNGTTPEKFFNDLFCNERNALVDFSRPTQSNPFTLWIIDQ